MSWIDKGLETTLANTDIRDRKPSAYTPTDEEAETLGMIRKQFAFSYDAMFRPRIEFNDLSVIGRDQTDFLAFNAYQPNNGQPAVGDQVNGWHSRALRPVERNKAISIAAHATARMLYPKIEAFSEGSEHQEAAATVMRDLIEWTADTFDYPWMMLQAIIQALVAPVSITHSEYVEAYRMEKEIQEDGSYKVKQVPDEVLSGFRDTVVPADQFFIANFYEQDVQKQDWVIWRKVISYDMAEEKYKDKPNFQYVRPGMQVLYNDPNMGAYYVYDPLMRGSLCEEIIYWNRKRDLRLVVVNGILLTKCDEPNPRQDKLYPFSTTGFEIITSRCFYYKSLVFKLFQDAYILNTLYPMAIDAQYLNTFSPFFATGTDSIDSSVIVPGKVTALQNPESTLAPVKPPSDVMGALNMLKVVEESLDDTSSVQPIDQGGDKTAYEVSIQEQNRNAQLGLFLKMIGKFVLQYGRLRVGDIKQYMTLGEVNQIEDNPALVYKTFFTGNKNKQSKRKTKKIMFDSSLMTSNDDEETESFKTLSQEKQENVEIWRVNPELFRNLSYRITMTPDILSERSDDVERLYNLEIYDRAIQNPNTNQEAVLRDFLFSTNAKSARDPDKYIMKQPQGGPIPQGGAPGNPMPGLAPQGMAPLQQPQPAMAGM